MRAPYAPGQRASRVSRRSAPADMVQTPELEATAAAADELGVTTYHTDVTADADRAATAQEPSAPDHIGELAPPARAEHLPTVPAHRFNGHTHDADRRNGHIRERDQGHDHDRTYTPAHQQPEFERADPEAESFDDADRESPHMLPRGDVRGEVGPLIDDLKALFQRDRATASATGGTRCGICYLHFALDALEYRDDEGYYVCAICAQSLGAARLPMVRRQKRG